MAKFQPDSISNQNAEVTNDGLKLNITLPHKTFSTGKKGFFKQGMLTTSDGKKYRINLQAYEAK